MGQLNLAHLLLLSFLYLSLLITCGKYSLGKDGWLFFKRYSDGLGSENRSPLLLLVVVGQVAQVASSMYNSAKCSGANHHTLQVIIFQPCSLIRLHELFDCSLNLILIHLIPLKPIALSDIQNSSSSVLRSRDFTSQHLIQTQ